MPGPGMRSGRHLQSFLLQDPARAGAEGAQECRLRECGEDRPRRHRELSKGKPTWPKGSTIVGEGVCSLGNNSGVTGKTFKNKGSLKCCVSGPDHRQRHRDAP